MLITCLAPKAGVTVTFRWHFPPETQSQAHFPESSYYRSHRCFGARHEILQPGPINHFTAALHSSALHFMHIFLLLKTWQGLPRRGNLTNTSCYWVYLNYSWTCCRFHPKINLKPGYGPRSCSSSVEWHLLRCGNNKAARTMCKQQVWEIQRAAEWKKKTCGNRFPEALGEVCGSLKETWLQLVQYAILPEVETAVYAHYIRLGSFIYF